MPNIINNTIFVRGKEENLDKFLADGNTKLDEEGNVCFSSYIPMPQTFEDYDTTNHPWANKLVVGDKFWHDSGIYKEGDEITEEVRQAFKDASKYQSETYGVVGWYDWRNRFYGTKWDCSINLVSRTKNELVLSVDSAWTTPLAFFCEMAKRYDFEIEIFSHDEYPYNTHYLIVGEDGDYTEYEDEDVSGYANEVKAIIKEFLEEEGYKDYEEALNNFIEENQWNIANYALDEGDSDIDFFLYYLDYAREHENEEENA